MTAAHTPRTILYLSIAGLMVMMAAISAISTLDPSGFLTRFGMAAITLAAALVLPWRPAIGAVLVTWLAPNLARALIEDVAVLNSSMVLALPALAGIGFFAFMVRQSLTRLDSEAGDFVTVSPETEIYPERLLRPFIEAEIARSRRFQRTFSLVLVGTDALRQKFDYRDDETWKVSLKATAFLLRQTRQNVDRVFHYKDDGFAIILPESTEQDVPGLVRRLRRLARASNPPEGQPGGPLAAHFGATFFPENATSVDDLLRRAEVALRIAMASTTRYQLDGAEAPELPPAESLRRDDPAPPTGPDIDAIPAISSDVITAIEGPLAAGDKVPTAGKEAPVPAIPMTAEDSSEVPIPPHPPNTGTSDEFETLLKQMEETRQMIRSVRNQAA